MSELSLGLDEAGQPLPAGWWCAIDGTSGKPYYYNRKGERTWEKNRCGGQGKLLFPPPPFVPSGWWVAIDPNTGESSLFSWCLFTVVLFISFTF